jgi:hypothetical protein
MNTLHSRIASPRNQRILFSIALLVLAAGIVALVVKLTGGGSDSTPVEPAKGFKPRLPPKTQPLENSDGIVVKNYGQLDPDIRSTVSGFVTTAVLQLDYAASWKYIAPSVKRGYTFKSWATADAHPLIPLPGYDWSSARFRLEEATTKEILAVIRLWPKPGVARRPVPMRIGLAPNARDSGPRWLVNYWMPASSGVQLPIN